MVVAVALAAAAVCARQAMGTHRLVRHSITHNNSSGNSNSNHIVKVVALVLLKALRRQPLMTTSSLNDGNARWRGIARGMIFIILAGNRSCIFFFFFLILALSFTHARKLSSSFLVDRIVYQHVFYFASYGRGVSVAHLFVSSPSRVSFSSNRLCVYFFSSFVLPLPLFITLLS